MTSQLEPSVRPHAPEPLHQLLVGLSKSWLPWLYSKSTVPLSRVHEIHADARYDLGESLMLDQMRDIAISQLATSLRLQGMDDEAATMLGLLESLAHAGEIPFAEYISRVQNLFPRALETIDVTLRVKIMNALSV